MSLFSRDEKTRRPASISFYNALHEEKISDDEKIEFIELKDVLYHKEKNDVSFMVAGKIIVLVEHQSTVNEYMETYKNFNFYMFTLKSFTTYFIYSCKEYIKYSLSVAKNLTKIFATLLPLRFLLYIAVIYQLILDVSSRYKERLFKIPKPEFYVIYNGKKERPAIEELRLSDAFMDCGMEPPLELIVKVININHPDNKEFLEKCEQLKGYKEFGDVMNDFISRYGEKGYDLGIAYCIKHGILADYLQRNIKEVLNMLRAKYSYKDEIRVLTQEAREEGWESGRAEEKSIIARSLVNMGVSLDKISKATGLSEEKIASL